MALPLALGLTAGGLQAAMGIGQFIKGSSMKPERPEYEIPSQVREAENLMRDRSIAPLAGENLLRQDIDASFANTVDAARRVGGNTDMLVAGAGQQYSQMLRDLGINRARAREMAERSLAQQLGLSATYEDQAFELNQMQPYMDAIADKSRLMEGGIQNIFGGLETGVTSAIYQSIADSALSDEEKELLRDKVKDLEARKKEKRANRQEGQDQRRAGRTNRRSDQTSMLEPMLGDFFASNPEIYEGGGLDILKVADVMQSNREALDAAQALISTYAGEKRNSLLPGLMDMFNNV